MPSFSVVWTQLLRETLATGHTSAPRGHVTRECYHRTIHVPMRQPVLCHPLRKLNYQFMAAEAYWILSGDDRVETITPYNSRLAQYSDDGVRFFGAYGPKIVSQLPYVIQTLRRDPASRQAGLTLWRENPPPTKDVPCTIAMFFMLRDARMHVHVFMRSSDIWLGVPYDVFNFSMVGHAVCALLNEHRPPTDPVCPGTLFLTAASSHLYEPQWSDAAKCIEQPCTHDIPETPMLLWNDYGALMEALSTLRHTRPHDPQRWWEGYHGTTQPR